MVFSSTTIGSADLHHHHRAVPTDTRSPTRTGHAATIRHTSAAPGPITAPPGTRTPRQPRTGPLRRVRAAGTRGHIRLLAACAALVTVGLVTLLLLEVNRERDGLRTIGDQAGPEVIATSDLYFALNDMDAQIANVLLVGDAHDLGFTRTDALRIYEQRRQQADRDVRQAAVASTDPATQQTLGAILDDLGQYEALAAQTILLDQQNPHPPGRPTPATLAAYRQTTDLLKTQLLPAAHQLTDQHAAALEATYRSQHDRIQSMRVWVLVTGVLLLAVLLALQIYLTRRFRRLLNPALAAATALAVTGVVLGTGLLTDEAEHLRSAKKDAFDSILVLTQARAVSYDANADESRYLVDPDRAARYQQAFLDKSQQLATLTGATLTTYDQTLAGAITAYQQANTNIGWTGFYGTEFRNITFTGERAAAETTLLQYQTYQRDDRQIRALVAAGRLRDAIAFCTGYAPGQSNYDFDQYDKALAALIAINQDAFSQSITDGDHEIDGWTPALLVACAVILALTVIGIRPRLAEYR